MQRRAVNFITMYNQHLCNTSDSLHSLHFLLCSKKFFWGFSTIFLRALCKWVDTGMKSLDQLNAKVTNMTKFT